MKRGKQRETPDPSTLRGRLRLAAEAVSLKSEAVADRLAPRLGGLTGAAVRKWWLGMSEPPFSVLEHYADVSGCSLFWLITGQIDPRELLPHLSVAVEQLQEAVATGENAVEAWERILGQPGLLEPEEREVLTSLGSDAGKAEALLRSLGAFRLSQKQSQLVSDLVEELAGSRAGRTAGRDRGPEPKP